VIPGTSQVGLDHTPVEEGAISGTSQAGRNREPAAPTTTRNDHELAAIVGGGQKVRYITRTATETIASDHIKWDTIGVMGTASIDITNAGGPETAGTMARFNLDLHSHEEVMEEPQPRRREYPTRKSKATGM
jgi:hypothetical protein